MQYNVLASLPEDCKDLVTRDITSDMKIIFYLPSKMGSSIPRGFSRRYILQFIEQHPMTTGEIINKAIEQSEGRWKPSPKYIYPMLWKLFAEGLISEVDNGR